MRPRDLVLPAIHVAAAVLVIKLVRLVAPKRKKCIARSGSSLRDEPRHVTIVTTAALPWLTGTAINPLLRAAYLSQIPNLQVTLVVPWLPVEDQQLIFPHGITFEVQREQVAFINNWVQKRTGFSPNFSVLFYNGKYRQGWGSIFPMEDIVKVMPKDREGDVVILEEPEHLNWFQHGERWTDKYKHVVGVMHTNYLAYARHESNRGFLNVVALYRITKWACRIHCHKVIKLSDAVQKVPRSITCNVHGVCSDFLQVGKAKSRQEAPRFAKDVYFIGKVVWAKGYTQLLELLSAHKEAGRPAVSLDVVGSGEDLEAVRAEGERRQLTLNFLGPRDHLDQSMHEYKVLVNPSRSDVLATTTAEALAMGKWVVVEDLPCNAFFRQFPTCLTYSNPLEFVSSLDLALASEPPPLTEELLNVLSWEAATERLLDAAELKPGEWPSGAEAAYDSALWQMYKSLAGLNVLRTAMGVTNANGCETAASVVLTDELEAMAREPTSESDLAALMAQAQQGEAVMA